MKTMFYFKKLYDKLIDEIGIKGCVTNELKKAIINKILGQSWKG